MGRGRRKGNGSWDGTSHLIFTQWIPVCIQPTHFRGAFWLECCRPKFALDILTRFLRLATFAVLLRFAR
jgi:hypothetical protein